MRFLPLGVFVFCLGAADCDKRHHSRESAADFETAGTPSTARTPANSQVQKQTGDARCAEPPTFPEPLPDPEYNRLLFGQMDPLWETGRFVLGSCIAEVKVNEQGAVDDVRFLRPQNADDRVKKAILTTQASRHYKPARACGRPVPFVVTVAIGHCPVPASRSRSAVKPR
jgi:hypothetical protein